MVAEDVGLEDVPTMGLGEDLEPAEGGGFAGNVSRLSRSTVSKL